MIKPQKAKKNKVPVMHLDDNSGGHSTNADSQIKDNQAANCQNVLYDGKQLNSRPGQTYLYPTSLGVGAINGEWYFKQKNGTETHLIHHTTKLYTQTDSNQPVLIYSALADSRSKGFSFADFFFIVDGTNFVCYDGTTVTTVASKGFIPTLTQGRKPDGSVSIPKQDLNILSDSWIDSFSADSSVSFTMSSKELKIALTGIGEVKVNGVVTTAYTVTLADHNVNFTVAPPAGTNNVTITGISSGLKDPSIITKCKYFALFGSRIWLTGNADNPGVVYWSGLTTFPLKDPFYWPDNNFNLIGSSNDPNGPMIPHSNNLILFKEHSTYRVDYASYADGTAQFNFFPANYTTGCDMPHTVQLVDNDIVFANTYKGVCVLRGVLMGKDDERSINCISTNINGTLTKVGLLNEQHADLLKASAIDDGKRYWICVKNKAWVWDYTVKGYTNDDETMSWWPMTNINANVWLQRDREVSYGDRTTGLIVKLTPGIYNDFGIAINKVFRFKQLDFGSPEWLKNINQMWIIVPAGIASSLDIRMISDDDDITEHILASETSRASWLNYSWDTFTWRYPTNELVIPLRPSVKNTQEFTLELSNNVINENLALVRTSLQVILSKQIK